MHYKSPTVILIERVVFYQFVAFRHVFNLLSLSVNLTIPRIVEAILQKELFLLPMGAILDS